MAKATAKVTAPPQKSGDFVTVFCKLPHGVRLRAFVMAASREVVMGAPARDIEVARATGDEFLVRGVAAPFGQAPRAIVTEAGYAITPNCPKDIWDNWFAANEKSPMVVNKLIYAERTTARGVDEGKDYASLTSGMEPLKPVGDPRAPKPRNGLTVVGTADESRDMLLRSQVESEMIQAARGGDEE